jgi:hypothetical protein
MIVNPTPSGSTFNENLNAWTWSTLPSGTTAVRQATNNYNSTSQTFQQMNSIIVNLDNSYKGLSSGQQSNWEAQAAATPGIKVCGCPGDIDSGQKLYRLQNYNRVINGQPQITDPLTPAATLGDGLEQVLLVKVGSGDPLAPYAAISENTNAPNTKFIVQLGQGNGNPQLLSPAPGPFGQWRYFPGDPVYSLLEGHKAGDIIYYCIWDSEGYPRGEGSMPVVTNPP